MININVLRADEWVEISKKNEMTMLVKATGGGIPGFRIPLSTDYTALVVVGVARK